METRINEKTISLRAKPGEELRLQTHPCPDGASYQRRQSRFYAGLFPLAERFRRGEWHPTEPPLCEQRLVECGKNQRRAMEQTGALQKACAGTRRRRQLASWNLAEDHGKCLGESVRRERPAPRRKYSEARHVESTFGPQRLEGGFAVLRALLPGQLRRENLF